MSASIRANQFATLANGMRLHYASAGRREDPLILFVHGFPEFWYEWSAQLIEFGDSYFAVAPDLRGFNLSDMPEDVSAYKAKYIVEDLRLLITYLGYQKAIIVAHDWGGAICWNLAIALPELVEKLIIINSPHPYLFAQALAQDPAQQASSEYMNWLRKEGSEQALAKNDFALAAGFFTSLGQGHASWFDDATRQKYHECWSRGLLGGVNYYRASPLHPPTENDKAAAKLNLDKNDFMVKIPTCVIWGEMDKALPKNLLDGLEMMVADLQVVGVPDGSHWIIHEQTDKVNSLIHQFLKA